MMYVLDKVLVLLEAIAGWPFTIKWVLIMPHVDPLYFLISWARSLVPSSLLSTCKQCLLRYLERLCLE